jgi:hypothetical protein
MFYATGDAAVVDKMIDLCRDWSVEVLTKGGREGAARFYVAKTVRCVRSSTLMPMAQRRPMPPGPRGLSSHA